MKIFLLPGLVIGGLGAVSSATTISINTSKQLQVIEGFGFSQAFTRAGQFQNATAGLQKQALDYLFSTETGAGFSIIRNWIPSTPEYTIEPNAPVSPTSPPHYVWDNDDDGQVWFTKEAIRYGVKTIYADAWSAPGFMKTSGNESSPGYATKSNYCVKIRRSYSFCYHDQVPLRNTGPSMLNRRLEASVRQLSGPVCQILQTRRNGHHTYRLSE